MKMRKMILCATLTGLVAVSGGALALQPYETVSAEGSTFEIVNTAELRLDAPEGIRFRVSVSESAKSSFGEDAEYGILLLPESMLGAKELEFDENGQVAIADTLVIETKAWIDDSTYACVLSAPKDENGNDTAFPESYYNAPIVARGYVKESNGDIAYTTNIATRSIGYIAKLCEVEGLTTADGYAGVAKIAQGTNVQFSVNNGNMLVEDKSYTPTFTIGGMPADSSDKVEVSYVSSNEDAVIFENGELKAVGAGTATISARISCYESESVTLATQEITVQEKFEYLRSLDGEENTLLFLDRTDGVKQVAKRNKAFELHYTDKKAYGDEVGSLQIDFPGNLNDLGVYFDVKNYVYSATDYAVFYVYNGASAECINMYFSGADAMRLNKDEWTMVVRPASYFATTDNYLQFKGVEKKSNTYYGGVANNAITGSVYVSKVKVYSAQEVFALAGASEWSIGDTTFTAISEYNSNPKMQYTNSATNDPNHNEITSVLEYKAYMVNGEFRQVLWRHSYAGFEATLKTSVNMATEDMYIAITIKGATDKFTMLPITPAGGAWLGAQKPTKIKDEANGYVTYLLKITKENQTMAKLRVTPCGDTRFTSGTSATGTNGTFDSHEIRISNITIGNAAKMAELGYSLA